MIVLRLVGLVDGGVNSNSASSCDLFRCSDFCLLEDRLFVLVVLFLALAENIPGPEMLCDPLRRGRMELGDRPSNKDWRSARVTLDGCKAFDWGELSKIGGPKNWIDSCIAFMASRSGAAAIFSKSDRGWRAPDLVGLTVNLLVDSRFSSFNSSTSSEVDLPWKRTETLSPATVKADDLDLRRPLRSSK